MCWGLNNYGQLGTGDNLNKLIPTTVKNGEATLNDPVLE